jgi:Amt family ammonium transporter
MVVEVKKIFGYDDTLDVFGIHGFGGTIGAVMTGVLATGLINPIFGEGIPVGLVDGRSAQVVNQLIAIGVAVAFAVAGTLVSLRVVDLLIGLRVSETEEITGLDATQHGEAAYVFEVPATAGKF